MGLSIIVAVILSANLMAQVGAAGPLSGTWINQDPHTLGITEIVVRHEGGRIMVHAWGRCSPIDCDWGEVEAEPSNGVPLAIWKHGFETSKIQLVLQPDGRLSIVRRTEFHDDSGRSDPGHEEFFKRQEPKPDPPEAAAARELLKSVAALYRSFKTAHIEATSTTYQSQGSREFRRVATEITDVSAPDHMRLESRGSGLDFTQIADGSVVWRVFPQSNDYLRFPQAADAASLEYSRLDQVRGIPRITEHEQFGGAGCTVVRIDMGSGQSEEVWIDERTHLVRKAIYASPPAANGAPATLEKVYTATETDRPLDPALFRYDPAKTNARSRGAVSREGADSMVGKPAPEFTLRDLEGREVRLSQLRGKVVVLDFWGAWCGPCREALPALELLHRAGAEKGVVVLGIDSESPDVARDFLARNRYTFPSLVDVENAVAGVYHVRVWPTTVVIGRGGNVADIEMGTEPQKLRDVLLRLGVW